MCGDSSFPPGVLKDAPEHTTCTSHLFYGRSICFICEEYNFEQDCESRLLLNFNLAWHPSGCKNHPQTEFKQRAPVVSVGDQCVHHPKTGLIIPAAYHTLKTIYVFAQNDLVSLGVFDLWLTVIAAATENVQSKLRSFFVRVDQWRRRLFFKKPVKYYLLRLPATRHDQQEMSDPSFSQHDPMRDLGYLRLSPDFGNCIRQLSPGYRHTSAWEWWAKIWPNLQALSLIYEDPTAPTFIAEQ